MLETESVLAIFGIGIHELILLTVMLLLALGLVGVVIAAVLFAIYAARKK